MTCDRNSHSAREDGLHNDDKDVASDADRTRTSDPWDTRAPPTKGQEVPPADMDFARRGLNKKTTRCLTGDNVKGLHTSKSGLDTNLRNNVHLYAKFRGIVAVSHEGPQQGRFDGAAVGRVASLTNGRPVQLVR